MRLLPISFALLALRAACVFAEDQLQIDVTTAVECERRTHKGDTVKVHYRGTLQDTGVEFDASYKRGQPLSFALGQGSVIKGWDEGLTDMCIGEKRTLTIPPSLGYGQRAMGPIPAGSTLIFETELMGIEGVETPATIVTKSASSVASSVATEATEGVKAKIMEKVEEAAEALKVTLADTDGDGQEHNEL